MTRLILVLGILGATMALAIPLLPQEWRGAVAVGWGLGMGAEALLLDRRLRAMRSENPQALLGVMVLGFLGRLTLLFSGAVVGAFSGLYPERPFLGGILAAFLVGEALSLPGLMRAKAARAGRDGEPADPLNPS